MTREDAWSRVMGVEKWIERWMTHYHVRGDLREDVRHAVMVGLVERAERWQPERGAWITFATPWIRALVQIHRRDIESEFGPAEPRLSSPWKNELYDDHRSFEPSMDEDMDVARSKEVMTCAKLRLTQRERVVIELVLAGMTLKSIAIELGCSRQNVAKLHARAIEKMRSFVESVDDRSSACYNAASPGRHRDLQARPMILELSRVA